MVVIPLYLDTGHPAPVPQPALLVLQVNLLALPVEADHGHHVHHRGSLHVDGVPGFVRAHLESQV